MARMATQQCRCKSLVDTCCCILERVSAMHPHWCRREQVGTRCDSVAGGTAWAVHMAGTMEKPVFVFDDEVRDGQCPSVSKRRGRRHATTTARRLRAQGAPCPLRLAEWLAMICRCHPRRRAANSAASAGMHLIEPAAAWFHCQRVRRPFRRCCRTFCWDRHP